MQKFFGHINLNMIFNMWPLFVVFPRKKKLCFGLNETVLFVEDLTSKQNFGRNHKYSSDKIIGWNEPDEKSNKSGIYEHVSLSFCIINFVHVCVCFLFRWNHFSSLNLASFKINRSSTWWCCTEPSRLISLNITSPSNGQRIKQVAQCIW